MKSFFYYFKQSLNESKFREIDETLIEDVKDVVKTYNLVYKKLSKSELKLFTTKVVPGSEWAIYFKDEEVDNVAVIKKISFTDLLTNKPKTAEVIVAYGGNDTTYATYDDDNNVIVLNHNNIKALSEPELEAVIVHELTHGFQQYKKSSEAYNKAMKRMSKGLPYSAKAYYNAPIEVDAHFTELAHRIKRDYETKVQAIEDAALPESKKVLQKKLDRFLLELKLFIKSEAKSHLSYQELPLPAFCSTHDEFLETLSKKPELWRKLKQKLTQLYVDLTDEYPV